MKEYEKEVKEYEKTRKRQVKAKKYDTTGTSSDDSDDDVHVRINCTYFCRNARATCYLKLNLYNVLLQTTSEEYSTMDEDELILFDHDTYHTRKLKHKCKRLVSECIG